MRRKKALLLVALILLSAAIIAVPMSIRAQEKVRLKFRYPDGYDYYPPPATVGEYIWVTVDIEAPLIWDKTPQGIIGYAFIVHVDPEVLEPVTYELGVSGYYLCDFCAEVGWPIPIPPIPPAPDPTTGDM